MRECSNTRVSYTELIFWTVFGWHGNLGGERLGGLDMLQLSPTGMYPPPHMTCLNFRPQVTAAFWKVRAWYIYCVKSLYKDLRSKHTQVCILLLILCKATIQRLTVTIQWLFWMSQDTGELTEITVWAPNPIPKSYEWTLCQNPLPKPYQATATEKYVVTIQLTEDKFKKSCDTAPMVTKVSSLVSHSSSVEGHLCMTWFRGHQGTTSDKVSR